MQSLWQTWEINENEKDHEFVTFGTVTCSCGSNNTDRREKAKTIMLLFQEGKNEI